MIIPFAEINARALVRARSLVQDLVPGGKFEGDEYVVKNPRRPDATAGSFKVDVGSGKWADFATGDRGGDLIGYAAYVWGAKPGEAAKRLSGMLCMADPAQVTRKSDAWEPLLPAPSAEEINFAEYVHFEHGKPTHVHRYTDIDGRLHSVILRFEFPDRDKKFAHLTYGRYKGKVGWHLKSVTGKRLLYNLEELHRRAGDPVLVLEGEKKVEAAKVLFPEYVIVTSCGGAQAYAKTDWKHLEGRTVLILPDHDEPGATYAAGVAKLASTAGAKEVHIAKLDGRFPDGWDVGDPMPDGVTIEDFRSLLKGASESEWPSIKPLPDDRLSAPTLPPEMLPRALRRWLVDVAERLSVPLECVAAPALTGLATVIGRKVGIMPKRYDNWMVLGVFWCVLIARPGKKKTAAIKAALRPLEALEDVAQEQYDAESPLAKVRTELQKARRGALQERLKDAAKKKDDTASEEAQSELVALEREGAAEKHVRRRYRTNDPTIERLVELLGENPNGLLLERDELMGFLKTFEKEGREVDRAFYLQCWNGNGRHYTDRVSREAFAKGLYLNIIGGTQPGKFDEYIVKADGGDGDDGLVQRFQMMIFPDFPEGAKEVDRVPDAAAYERAKLVFQKLDAFMPTDLGLPVEGDEVPALRFSPTGQEVFNAWLQALMDRLDAMEPILESHFSKYRSLMPALALIFHLVDWASGDTKETAVSEAAARLASDWCDFLEQHARKTYSPVTNREARAAQTLAAKVKHGHVKSGMSLRDILRREWAYLKSADLVHAAVDTLSSCHWLRVERKAPEGGGRPTEIVTLHPSLVREGAR